MREVFSFYEAGHRIGNYSIVKRLERRVEYPCRVFLAGHEILDRRAEIRMLTEPDEALVAEWYDNARLMGRLSHPNIPALYDVGVHDGRPYMAIEYVEGPSYYDLVAASARTSLSVVLKIMASVARALMHAHERGAVHKNIELNNVIIGPSGEAYLCGFWGPPEDPAAFVPDVGGHRVRRYYASAEQQVHEPVSARGNLWDFGAMMYHLLAGRPPYSQKDFARARDGTSKAAPIDFSRLDGKAPEFVRGVVRKCMAGEDGEGFTGAREVVRDLEAAIDYLEVTGGKTVELAEPAKGQTLLLHVEYRETDRPGSYRQYEIGDHISSGSYGAVYRARELLSGGSVALKILKHQWVADPDAVTRFRREAALLAQLTHPNVVGLHNWGRWGISFFIAMDLLEGLSVAQLLTRDGPMSFAEAFRLGRDVTAGAAAVHEVGAVHRDLKPANVCRFDGRYVIFDFGMAHVQDADRLTNTGVLPGSPAYFSPEQAEGLPVTGASDVYAIGVTLYEALSGKLPHSARSTPRLLRRIAEEPPVLLSKHRPGIPAHLADLVDNMMAKDPRRRPSAREAHEVLARETGSEPEATPA